MYLVIPPRTSASDGVVIGFRHGGDDSVVRIPYNEVLRHAIVVGSTGSGKTTTTATLSLGLSRYGEVVIIDWFGEYRSLLSKFKNNDLIVKYLIPGVNTRLPLPNDPEDLLSILDDVLELTAPQSYILSKVLREYRGSYSNVNDIMEFIEGLGIEAKWMLESKYALIRKLEPLVDSNVFELVSNRRYFTSRDNINNVIIIDLSRMKNQLLKKLATLSILKVIEHRRLVVNELRRKNLFVIIEEVHNILGVNRELLERLISEIRKLNVGLVLVTQSPSTLGYRIITNANLRIVHTLKYKEDIDIMCRNLACLSKCQELLPRLKVGEAVIDSSYFSIPLIVDVIEPSNLHKYLT